MNFPGGHRATDSAAMPALPRMTAQFGYRGMAEKCPEANIGRVRYACSGRNDAAARA
jgi:hypothetical protein